jgi:EAL domain-containing protein (putative c-di-GMP-specific phosphodiesterase class I)
MTAAKFIASVEAAGLIWPLGDVILRHALRQVGAWAAQGLGTGGRIAVNIGAQQLTNVAIVDHIQACLADAGLAAQHLAVEVTEAIALGPAGDLVLERLNTLHDLGIEVVLDDFGTGHASLALLERLPVNRVKIDRTVVAGIDVVPSCKPIIRTVTDLAHSLSLQVVAEGVETREQMHFLQLCGCDGGQGNLFAPPMSGGEATSWLAARASAATGLGAPVPFAEIGADVGSGGGIGGRGRLH